MLTRRRRVDDLRLTSMSEDLSMLAENNGGLERVLKMEYEMRLQAQQDLHERSVGHADGVKVREPREFRPHRGAARRYRTLSGADARGG